MKKQAQTRIVLNEKFKPIADELLDITGIESLSSLFSVLLTCYGKHLKAYWNMQNSLQIVPALQPMQSDFTPQVQPQQQIQQTLTAEFPPEVEAEVEQAEDPVIKRMAQLIENF